MMMMVLVSKQHEVTTKYKMQALPHFSLICLSRETLSYKNAGPVGFAAGQVDFQVTCPAGQVAMETIFEAGHYMYIFKSKATETKCSDFKSSAFVRKQNAAMFRVKLNLQLHEYNYLDKNRK